MQILKLLSHEHGLPVDSIVVRTGLAPDAVSAVVGELQKAGLVTLTADALKVVNLTNAGENVARLQR